MNHSSMIGQLTIRSNYAYVVYGDVRGVVSEHRTLSGALRSLESDRRGCSSQGGYSDASVYEWTDGQWMPVIDDDE